VPSVMADLDEAGSLAPNERDSVLAEWTGSGGPAELTLAATMYAMHRDTVALRRLSDRLERRARTTADALTSASVTYAVTTPRAHLTLLRGDSARAAELFLSLQDSLCSLACARVRLVRARLLSSLGRSREAAAMLDRYPPLPGALTYDDAGWHLERARVARALGDTAQATRSYRVVVATWARADPRQRATVQEGLSWLSDSARPRETRR